VAPLAEDLVPDVTQPDAPAGSPADPLTEKILDAALAEMLEFGLQRTRVEDVIRRARIGRMTLYRRFPGKDELFAAVVLRQLELLVDRIRAVVQAQPTVQDAVVESLVVGLRMGREHPLMVKLMSSDAEYILPFMTIRAAPMIDYIAAFIVELIGATVPEDQVGPLSEALTRVAHSFLLTPYPGDEAELRAHARTFIALLIPE
jgi:AcrR family transcriptional regulator